VTAQAVAGERANNSVRIVGGTRRGQRVRFPGVRGLRPTPERQRETLFNWLAAEVTGGHCLDLFAGSGVLGFEALSRGAAHVHAVDASKTAIRVLAANATRLGLDERVTPLRMAATRFLQRRARPFDVVFLDPPYRQPALAAQAMALLSGNGWLAADARVYVELERTRALLEVPDGWTRLRRQAAGNALGLLYATPA
jgi:16S rRNA (guanine966-N2)-methyltransferase